MPTIYNTVSTFRILPMDHITVDYDVDGVMETVRWSWLEEDSAMRIAQLLRPEDVGAKLQRVVGYEIDVTAIVPHNAMDTMRPHLRGIVKHPIKQIHVGLFALAEQDAGAQMLISLDPTSTEVYEWRADWSVDQAGPRPRLTINCHGLFSADALDLAGDAGGMFNQLNGW